MNVGREISYFEFQLGFPEEAAKVSELIENGGINSEELVFTIVGESEVKVGCSLEFYSVPREISWHEVQLGFPTNVSDIEDMAADDGLTPYQLSFRINENGELAFSLPVEFF